MTPASGPLLLSRQPATLAARGRERPERWTDRLQLMTCVHDVFPDFVDELVELVEASMRPELAEQIPTLDVVDRCRCGHRNCAHFYTAPRPSGAYPPGRTNVALRPRRGLIVLDVLENRIVGVEVLERPDVKKQLDAAFA